MHPGTHTPLLSAQGTPSAFKFPPVLKAQAQVKVKASSPGGIFLTACLQHHFSSSLNSQMLLSIPVIFYFYANTPSFKCLTQHLEHMRTHVCEDDWAAAAGK